MHELLTIGEVARLLRCSPAHVRRLLTAQRLPKPIRLGALSRWRRCDIEQWIQSRCEPPWAAAFLSAELSKAD